MSLRERLLAFLRVPPAPSAPAGDHDVRVFRAARNYFYYKLAQWGLRNAGAVIGLFVGVGFLRRMPDFEGPLGLLTQAAVFIEAFAIVGVVAQALWTLALLRLDFEQRWYLVSDRSLRIREGIVRMHEKTMTFANIQQVTINQGPLQRLLGISDLQVRTAGGGGGSSEEMHDQKKHDLHIAYFRGVDNAPAIRETIRERLRRHADAGLGDPDDTDSHLATIPENAALVTAARALALEARALRNAADSANR